MNKSKKRNNTPVLSSRIETGILFFSISMVILIYWRWFLPGVITWGDWHYVSKSAFMDFFPSVWVNDPGLGMYQIVAIHLFPILALQRLFCEMLHLDYGIIERILWFFPFIFLSFFSPWYLARTLGFRRLGISAAILAFGLSSYPFLLASVMTLGVATVLVPLVFAFFIRIIQRPTFPRGLLFALVLTLQMVYELRVAYVTSIFCALYLLYFLIFERGYNLRQLGKTLFLTAIVVSFLNTFWLIPFLLKNLGATGDSLLPAGYVEAGALRMLSYMTLLHSLGVHVPWWGEPNIVNPVHPHFLVLPIAAFSVLLFRPKDCKVLFFALSALIFSFLVKGSNPPLGGVNIWLFLHLPGFFMFRTPGQWYPPLIISYAVLFAYLVEEIVNRKFLNRTINWLNHRQSLPLPLLRIGLVIGAIGAFFLIFPVQPISTHRFISHPRQNPGRKEIHHEKIYIPRQVPQEYLSLEDFLRKQPDFFRVLWFPLSYRFSYHSSQHPGLSGINLSERLLPFCSGNPSEWAYSFSYISHPSILLPLRLFSIKYIIVPDAPQDDYGEYYWYEHSPDYFRSIIEKTSRFSPVTFQGRTRLYEVPDPLPRLYIATIPTLIIGNLKALMPLVYNKYLDDRPIFFFDEQQEGKSLEKLLSQVSTVTFNNSNPSDLVLQILKPDYGVRSENRKKPVIFEAEKKGVYQIWKKQATGYKLQATEVKIDGISLMPASSADRLDPGASILEKAVKWEWMGSVELEKGKHRVTVEKAPQEIVIVPEKKIIEVEGKIRDYLKKVKVPPTYFFSKELSGEIDSHEKRSLKGSFYIPTSGQYSLRAKVSPQYVEALDYGLSEDKYVKSRDYAFNKRIGRSLEFACLPARQGVRPPQRGETSPSAGSSEFQKEKSRVIFSQSFKDLDLKKYPYISLIHQNEYPKNLLVSIILDLDFNHDGKSDGKVTYEGVTAKYPFLNAYQLARAKSPDKNLYRLIKLEIKMSRAYVFSPGDVSEEPPFSLSLQHLQIYNEEILPYEEVPLTPPTLKIDQKKLSLAKSGLWYTAPTTYLGEGHHILDALFPGLETKLDFIAIEPISNIQHPASSSEPQVEFRKINPAKYLVSVKEAREPFWLVFSESFHEGWKAYAKPVRSSPLVPRGLEIPEGEFGVRSKKDKFEWLALLSAWKDRGKRIELKEHFMVNGYANGWFVPVDQFASLPVSQFPPPPEADEPLAQKADQPQAKTNEQTKQTTSDERRATGEMEIILEFVPQRLFETGVLISGLTLLGCVGYLTIGGVRRRKRRAGEQVRK